MEQLSYRVILCRYNELGLKSATYQKKQLKYFTDNIKTLCRREHLTLQSVLNLSGRLLFFFPSNEILSAIRVFRHVIGLISISPAFSVPRKINRIEQSILQLCSKLLQNGENIQLQVRSVVKFFMTVDELKKHIVNLIEDYAKTRKIQFNFAKNPNIPNTRKIGIEIREKGVYIYGEEYATIWGGFPMDTQNCLVTPWSADRHVLIGAMMMARRGAIITPIIFQHEFNKSKNNNKKQIPLKMQQSLNYLSIFYPDTLPILSIPINKQKSRLEQLFPTADGNKISNFLFYLKLEIMAQIIYFSRIQAFAQYAGRNLHYKGTILPNSLDDLYKIQEIQKFQYITKSYPSNSSSKSHNTSGLLPFFPLIGFSEPALNFIEKSIFSEQFILNPQSSFNHLLNQLIDIKDKSRIPSQSPENVERTNLSVSQSEMKKIFNDEVIERNLRKIIENLPNFIIHYSSSILNEK
ncbi:MAG: hypothetical protein ACTSVU_02970 [Promethearchaeota archaeon]